MTEDSAEAIRARMAARWDLDAPYPIPKPGWMRCPVCDCGQAFPKEWRFTTRGDGHTGRFSHRCDVWMKCPDCSAVWPHGLALTLADVARYGVTGRTTLVHWREAAGILAHYAATRHRARE